MIRRRSRGAHAQETTTASRSVIKYRIKHLVSNMYLMQQGDVLTVTANYISPTTLFSFKPFSKVTGADGKHAVLRSADMAFLRGHNADWVTLTEDKPEMNQDDDQPEEEVPFS